MNNPRIEYFDSIAERWDSWDDLATLERKLAEGLEELGVGTGETVLDVGCGTGNLTKALLARLSPAGRVLAVDISPHMIEVARAKIGDSRVTWTLADARHLPFGDGTCDRVICYSVWPHFDDPAAVASEFARVLRRSGRVHVWHLLSRHQINTIHASAGEAVRHDILAPADKTAGVFASLGFQITMTAETQERYLVTAVKPGG